VDATETDKEIKVSVELPGLDHKEINVTLTRGAITISGEKKQEQAKERHSYFLRERSYGPFKRTIALPCEVEAGKVNADFRKGVLTVTLPKAPTSQSRQRIAIRKE
jgi:HSP20 family protein